MKDKQRVIYFHKKPNNSKASFNVINFLLHKRQTITLGLYFIGLYITMTQRHEGVLYRYNLSNVHQIFSGNPPLRNGSRFPLNKKKGVAAAKPT